MNPHGVTQMLARLPLEKIKERLHIYQELPSKTEEDLLVEDMLNKELDRRERQFV
jgi:hypothetical protein